MYVPSLVDMAEKDEIHVYCGGDFEINWEKRVLNINKLKLALA